MAPPVNHARSGESSWVEATLPGPNICGIASVSQPYGSGRKTTPLLLGSTVR